MREMLGVALVATVSGCAQQVAAPAPVVAVTPSDQRATGDMVPDYYAEAAAGQLHVVAMLGDRLEQDAFPGPSIQLAPTEHLYVVIGTTRVPLAEELYAIAGFENPSILWARYTATIAVDDPQQLAIELDRADGSVVTSTLKVPARFAVTSAPASSVKMGDTVTFAIAPAPRADTWGTWDAWCNSAPTDLIYDGNYDDIYVSAAGQGTFQLGAARSGTDQDCAAQLQLKLRALGDYAAEFGQPTGPITTTHPMGLQDVEVGVHLWGF